METRLGKKKQKKILVVGKHPAIVVSLRTMLSVHNYHVLVTDEPDVAIELADAFHADIGLALIDVSTLEIEPRVLADRLRVVRPSLRVLFFSSLVDGEVIRLGIIDPVGGELRKEGVMAAIEEALAEETPGVNGSGGLKTMTAGGNAGIS